MKTIIPAPYKFEFHIAAAAATGHQVGYGPVCTAMTMLPVYGLAQALGGEVSVTWHVTPKEGSTKNGTKKQPSKQSDAP
jgi:hypothetical protein